MSDRRREPPTQVDLPLQVWGVDARGIRFSQDACATNISSSGALLSQLDVNLKSGDLIGVIYAGRKARFRVVWVLPSGTSQGVQAAVQRIEDDECPWQDKLVQPASTTPTTVSAETR
jgi:hypothetical protein